MSDWANVEKFGNWNGPVYIEDTDEIYENIQEFLDEKLPIRNPKIFICRNQKCGHDEEVWVPTNIIINMDTKKYGFQPI